MNNQPNPIERTWQLLQEQAKILQSILDTLQDISTTLAASRQPQAAQPEQATQPAKPTITLAVQALVVSVDEKTGEKIVKVICEPPAHRFGVRVYPEYWAILPIDVTTLPFDKTPVTESFSVVCPVNSAGLPTKVIKVIK